MWYDKRTCEGRSHGERYGEDSQQEANGLGRLSRAHYVERDRPQEADEHAVTHAHHQRDGNQRLEARSHRDTHGGDAQHEERSLLHLQARHPGQVGQLAAHDTAHARRDAQAQDQKAAILVWEVVPCMLGLKQNNDIFYIYHRIYFFF